MTTSPCSSAASASAASGTTTPTRAPPATSPRTSTSSRSRPTRAGRAATRRRPRSRPTWRTPRAATASSTASAPPPRSGAPRWDEQRRVWRIETSAGPHEAEVLLTACGQLSVPTVPPLPGLDSFAGPAFHTARWRHDVELAGKRVAVIGTGCSAIQVVPAIQPEVAQVDVYQRSPGWTFPKMDFPYSERTQRLFERFPVLQRLDRAVGLPLPGAGRGRDDQAPLAAEAVQADLAAAHRQGDRGSGAAPQGHADRRDRLQADHAHRRVVSDAHQAERRAGRGPHRRGHAGRDPHPVRRRAPRRRDRAGDGLRDARVRRADGDHRRRRAGASTRSGRRCRAPTSG